MSAFSVAVGLVGDLERRERHAGVERQRLVGAEARDRARRPLGLRAGELLHLDAQMRVSMRVIAELPTKTRPRFLRKHKTGGSTSGLLASLFNVAASRPAQIHHGTLLGYPSPLLPSMARSLPATLERERRSMTRP